jgi:hypothetical protein
LAGNVVRIYEGQPLQVEYTIDCDGGWRTQRVRIVLRDGGQRRRTTLIVDHEQRWWQDGVELERCRGCVDVDLAVSPVTNSLPIRRLALAAGDSATPTAAWVQFPSLMVSPLRQRYTRTASDSYRYESPDHDFIADIIVDEQGLVVQYADLWKRVA